MALSRKQRAFIDEYLVDFNATQAAIRAGYSERSAGVIGHENLRKPNLAAEISRRIAERTMTADEALIRLADMARGDLSDYISGDGLDVDRLVADGKGHLVKGIKRVRTQYDDRTEVEIYDKQAALKVILDHHDRAGAGPQEHVIMSLDEWKAEAERRRNEAAGIMAVFEEDETS